MKIQINTDHNVKGTEKFREVIDTMITEELDRFSSQITRVEVHLSDEDGQKDGQNDKRCMIEARLKGLKPVAVTNFDDTHEKSVDGAIEKMKSLLDTLTGRLKDKSN